MDQQSNEKHDSKDQVNKHESKKRTKQVVPIFPMEKSAENRKVAVVKLKQENNDFFNIVIQKGNIVLSLD
jgi:hypothetical protein